MALRESILLLLLASAAYAQVDAREIVRQSVAADEQNWKVARSYEFTERVDARQLDLDGKLKSQEIRIYDVLLLDGSPFRRLAGRDDQPLPANDQAREHSRFVKNRADRQNETARQRSTRIADYENRPEWLREAWRELPEVFDFRVSGEDTQNLVIDANPRADYRPKSRTAGVLMHMRAKLWIDKRDFHLAKAEVEALEPIWVGMFLVRLAKGSRAAFEYTKIDAAVWMPQRVQVSASIRLGLLKTLNIERDMRYGRLAEPKGNGKVGKIPTVNSESSSINIADSRHSSFSANKSAEAQTSGGILNWLTEQVGVGALAVVGHHFVQELSPYKSRHRNP